MRASLTTKVKVQVVQAWAELDFFEERQEIARLCRVARERGRLDKQAVLAALPGLSERAAGRIVNTARKLGLCGQDGVLTWRGEQAARDGEVPVPEMGVYRLALVVHRATGARILHVERLRPSDVDRDAGRWESDPTLIVPERDRPFRSVVQEGPTVAMRGDSFGPGAVIEDHGELTLEWTLNFDDRTDRLRVTGPLPGQFRRRNCGGIIEGVKVDLGAVLDAWNNDWMNGRWNGDFLEVGFDEVQDGKYGPEAVKTLRTDFQQTEVAVPGFDLWDAKILDVPLGPRKRRDGERWARYLLLHQLERKNGMHCWTEVRELYRRIVEKSPMEAKKPEVPGFEQLWREAREAAPSVAMRLAAAVDLAPTPLLDEVLSPCPWADDTEVVDTKPGQFSLVHGVRLSMRSLVEKLLRPARGNNRVERLLYVDRDATEPKNLLNLLALRNCLQAPLDVVTGKRNASAGGSGKVWSYEEFFGQDKRNQPHDRYFLVRTAGGAIAWHLSNALLDGRQDDGTASEDPEKPLQWRDLSAHLVDLATLQQAMRNWAKGGL